MTSETTCRIHAAMVSFTFDDRTQMMFSASKNVDATAASPFTEQ
jgi:hypothetical protein